MSGQPQAPASLLLVKKPVFKTMEKEQSIHLAPFYPKDGGTTIFRNVGNTM